MPEMDGIELARRATELDPDLKVMFITGFAAVALNPDSQRAQGCQGPVQALPPARPRQRGREAARRLTRPARGLHVPARCAWYIALAPLVHARRPGARSSAGEHYVDIVGVTGSIPVAPTIPVPKRRLCRVRGRPATSLAPLRHVPVLIDPAEANAAAALRLDCGEERQLADCL